MIQQQLLYTQMQMMQQQQQDKDGGVAEGGVATSSAASGGTVASHSMRGMEVAGMGGVLGDGSRGVGRTPGGDGTQYINGSDVMIGGSRSQSQLGTQSHSSGEEGDTVPPDKKARLDTSAGQ
jgi:hypothetical protein